MPAYAEYTDATFLNDPEAAQSWWDELSAEWKDILSKHANCSAEKPDFQQIAAIEKLKFPNANVANFVPLINLTNLRSITCYGCPELTNAANLPNLTALVCNNCPKLVSVTKLPSLTLLNCSNSPKLFSLSKLPNLTFLNFSNCPKLDKFHFLQNMSALQTLNCSNSKVLISKDLIPILSNEIPLKELHCKGVKGISLNQKNKFRDRGCVVFD